MLLSAFDSKSILFKYWKLRSGHINSNENFNSLNNNLKSIFGAYFVFCNCILKNNFYVEVKLLKLNYIEFFTKLCI